jgi:hypothetical protein
MEEKDKIIEKIYTDPSGFGSIENTLKEVRKIDKSITRKDVQQWIENNTHRKSNLRGYNSYVSPGPRHEYQIDLFFMSDLKNEEYHDYKMAMCTIDSFTKFLAVIPLKSKSESDFLAGLMESFKNLGKPKVIYADQEAAWTSKYVQQYLKEENILLIMTLSHAPIVERAIRTIKDMIYKRLEHNNNQPWYGQLLQQVIFIYNYGREHRTINMSPNDARKPQNEDKVRRNLNKNSINKREYPDVIVGDTVRIYQKKDKLDKQQKSLWSKNKYTVEDIKEENNQKFYKTSWNNGRLLLRHEILKIPN